MIEICLSTLLGQRRMTQTELARRTKIRLATINELYHDMTERVYIEYLDRICEVLECQLTDLLILTPNEHPLHVRHPELFQEVDEKDYPL